MGRKSLSLIGCAVAALATAASVALAEDKPLTERKQTVESAVSTPVEDLNIKKTKIPDVLQRAQANPYDLSATPTCDAIAAEVALITAELGDDHDDVVTKAEAPEQKGPSAGALLKAGVAEVIPFRGIVRQLSGAARHDRAVEDAIDAGFSRRGFLKGRALEMNCPAPASPAWFKPRPEKEAAALAQAQPPAPAVAPAVSDTPPAAPSPTPVPEATTAAPVEAPASSRPPVDVAPLPLIPGAADGALPAPQPQPGTLDAQAIGAEAPPAAPLP